MRHLKKGFEGSNYRIFESETGQKGIQFCKEENPDCILLDYLLPDMDGLEFLSLVFMPRRGTRTPKNHKPIERQYLVKKKSSTPSVR